MRGNARALIGPRQGDGLDEILDVELVGDELLRQLRQQLRMAGGVFVGRLIINRINNAEAEEMGPYAVGPGLSEIRILGGHEPIGQDIPAIDLVLPDGGLAVEEFGLNDLVGARDIDFPAVGQLDRWLRLFQLRLAIDLLYAGEEGRIFPELILGPLGEWMVMALCAFEANAEKNARGGRRQ